jgi:predicted NBD/HSP70 family sugar kinase
MIKGPVTVDNDVNWAARAERTSAAHGELDDFIYLYLGEGLGCAVVADGEVRRGHGGLAGEISHVLTRGSAGGAVRFIEIFAELHLRQPDSTAIDVEALLRAVEATDEPGILDALGEAICGVVTALVALTDPGLVVFGGTWGRHPAVVREVSEALARQPRAVPIRVAQLTSEPALVGARSRGLDDLRSYLLTQQPAPV